MESGRQKVTRKDVAREAGVSETIVSYVLNKNRYVKEEKRQRVLEVVEKLQYHPNNIARALHGKGSLQILFLAEELSSGYFSELVSQMSRDAYRRGYMISLCESQEEDEFVSQILSRQFDGLFVSASGVTDRELKLLVKSGIPMVLFLNREISCDLRDTVVVDTGLYEGSRECVKHLVKNGCRNFVYLDKTGKQCDRDIHWKGFFDQIKESEITFAQEQRISGCEDIKKLEKRLQLLLEKNPSVDAIVARYDNLAAVALSVAGRTGRKVPDDHCIIRSIFIIRGIIIFFQLLRSTILFVPCNTFMPVRCHCLQIAQFQYMSCFAILLAIDHINFKLTVFHLIFIIPLTEYIKDKIQPCKQKSRKHKCLGNRDSHNHKKHCKNNHYHTQDSGHTLFLS